MRRIPRWVPGFAGFLLLWAMLAGVASATTAPQTPPHLRVVTKSLPPFVIVGEGQPQGFSIDLLDKISSRMGFTYELEMVDTVNQQIEKVRNGDADMALAGISITAVREDRVDFSAAMFHSGLQVLRREEQGSTVDVAALFSQTVWPLLVQLFVVLFVVAHVVWLVRRRSHENFRKGYLGGIGEGLWFAAESMATVSYGDTPPRNVWGRLAAVAWMFLAIVVVAHLTGSISANLVSQRLEGSINGPDDLPGNRVATVSGTTSDEYLRRRDIDVVESRTVEGALDLLRDRKVDAVVMDSPVLRYFATGPGDTGHFELVGPVFEPQDYGIAVALGSPLRKPLNKALLEMQEDGTFERLEGSWFGDLE